jgi:hypothetical protein
MSIPCLHKVETSEVWNENLDNGRCGEAYVLNQLICFGKLRNTPERDQGRRVAVDLTCCLDNSHVATTDNFLKSFLLAENVLRLDITSRGIMRRNRNEIPHEPLPKKRRTVESSIIAFHDEVTLVSHVPKINRTVIALSTDRHGKQTWR